ncbi:WbqC family protein [Ramlibacter tataouinensis]|uniref:WbqC family protein n=1 Tax=Ramlibacter tataouinensis TaxID=94132 RepID=UPI0022F3A545|nr:WbqC family protein [Ramlibacter tataouinensis]WBY00712.1 WbqC family protein [Ramlibacter tataouinensis]
MSRVTAIHQPNFFPWLGYFDKIAQCDVFVVLDDVQYQKTGSNWSNRVKLLLAGEPRWVTAPVRRPAHGTAKIDELSWAQEPWREKLMRSLTMNYGSARFFRETMELIEPLVRNEEPMLAAYNLRAIRAICEALGLQRSFVLSSSFHVETASNERLISLCRHVGCDIYLTGGGAQDYQQDELFVNAGIQVRHQDFQHPRYPQAGCGDFVPGLSVIDALMNCGIDGTRKVMGVA